jgi:hypothetical protein
MAWIELHQELVQHKKMDRLLRQTGLSRDAALGRLCILWLWALSNRPDGDLGELDGRRLGQILELTPRKGESFLQALEQSGFLDRQGERLRIHDWEDYAGRLLEIKRRDRERKRLARGRQREGEDCPPDSPGTSAPVPGLPNQTQPDPTQPNLTKTEPKGETISAADASSCGCAGARGDEKRTADYLLERGLLADRWLGATEELLQRSRSLCDGVFRMFSKREPAEADYALAFPLVTRQEKGEDGQILRLWDEDRADLLRYAFEQAARCGAGGNWQYVEGVLGRLASRGIRTRRDAEIYDLRRDGMIE